MPTYCKELNIVSGSLGLDPVCWDVSLKLINEHDIENGDGFRMSPS